MDCFRFIFILVSVSLKLSNAVKVDMKGSLIMGKEVVNALKSFVDKNKFSRRRSMDVDPDVPEETEKDTVALIVHSSFLCRDIKFCKGDMGIFLNQYLIVLTKAVESVFEGLVNDIDKNNYESTLKPIIFEGELRILIRETKKLLRNASKKITEENATYMWIDLLKRINAKFQDTASVFATERLQGNVQEVTEFKKKLSQKLITAAILVELKYENKLCNLHNICSKSHEITKALDILLRKINTLDDEKAKAFIRHFYETLPDMNFYYRISDITGHEFQTILHDMAYADNIPTKNVLEIVHKIVEERLSIVNSKEERVNKPGGRDVKLVHVMLSDMDHFYSKHKKEPFNDFLSNFFEWTRVGGKFGSRVRRVMKDLQNSLSFESDELVLKLVNQMRVFMEISVDPEP